MEKKETTTQQKKNEPSECPTNDNKSVKDKSPTTPTSGSSWWGGFISQAKEKSASVLEAVKNDLNEITTAVSDTFHVTPEHDELSQQMTSVESQQQHTSKVNSMKQSISSFFGSVTDALIPQLDEEDAAEAVLITSDDTIVLSGFAKHLAELQDNDETYLEEPSKSEELAEKYRMWMEIVEQDQFTQQRVDRMLESSQILDEKYNKFVPDTVSHMNFFKRYLFKKALLEDELANEERKKKDVIDKQPEPAAVAVVEPEPIVAIEEKKDVEPNVKPLPVLKTDLNDMEMANFELSEEEQARLLEDYEQEIKEREKSKTETTEKPANVKTAMKSSKNPSKSSSNVQSKGKNNKNVKIQPQQQKSTQQPATKGDQKGKKLCASLEIEQDHFKKESESSTSDESWEKEFDL